jgi:hypothetical protein
VAQKGQAKPSTRNLTAEQTNHRADGNYTEKGQQDLTTTGTQAGKGTNIHLWEEEVGQPTKGPRGDKFIGYDSSRQNGRHRRLLTKIPPLRELKAALARNVDDPYTARKYAFQAALDALGRMPTEPSTHGPDARGRSESCGGHPLASGKAALAIAPSLYVNYEECPRAAETARGRKLRSSELESTLPRLPHRPQQHASLWMRPAGGEPRLI